MNGLGWKITIRKTIWFFLGIIVLLSLLFASVWVDSQVTFRDENLEAAIREVLKKPVKSLYKDIDPGYN